MGGFQIQWSESPQSTAEDPERAHDGFYRHRSPATQLGTVDRDDLLSGNC